MSINSQTLSPLLSPRTFPRTRIPHPSSKMPRSDEAESFFYAVYSAVQEIPYGKVTSYGHIAKLVGTRKPQSHNISLESRQPVLKEEKQPSVPVK